MRAPTTSPWPSWTVALIVALAALAVVPSSVAKAGPTFTTIDVPGATATRAFAINERGDVAGAYIRAGKTYGYLLTKEGELTTIDYPAAASTEAWGINARGDVVGRYVMGGMVHGFLLRDGQLSNVDVAGEPHTMPTGIGDDGTIVGCYHSQPWALAPPAYMHGYAQGPGGIASFPLVQSMHNGVAAGGSLIAGLGYDLTTGYEYPYLVRNGRFTRLEVPGAIEASAWDVNSRGEVVGRYFDGRMHGWLLSKGVYTKIDVPGAAATFTYGINDQGDIAGVYRDDDGFHGFVMQR
jgi:uncharacterized membrane protein